MGRRDRGRGRGGVSQIGARLLGVLAALPGDGAISLLPDGDAVTSADLFGVLEEARRTSDDATGQPV